MHKLTQQSKLTLGTFQFSNNWGNKILTKDIYKIFDFALENGVNSIETADVYDQGEQEKLIGHYNKSFQFVLTKFGQLSNFSYKSVQKDLENSLKRLKRDCIDVYFFHSGNDKEFFNDKLWEKLNVELKKGKIKKLGLSLKTSLMLNRKINQVKEMENYGISVLQVLYNPLFRNAEKEIFSYVKKKNIKLMTRAPFARGIIADFIKNNFKKKKQFNKYKKTNLTNIEIKKRIDFLIKSKSFNLKKINFEILKWISQNKLITSIIFGASSIEQLKENILIDS
jgi:aryl-alcohol dehydrogenase-like predicted oxidoreductase